VRLLDRYLLRELLVPLGFCLSGFLLFWIASDLLVRVDEFQEHHLRALDIAEYYLVRAPEFLAVVLPLALLLGLLYALTQHARYHEITAIRAAGVSLWRLACPYFLTGLAGCGVLFYLNEFCAPDSAERAEQILERRRSDRQASSQRHVVRNLGFVNARDQRAWHLDAYNLRAAEMTGPQVDYPLPDGSRRWLFAARAVWTNQTWVFYEVSEYTDDPRVNTLLTPYRRVAMLARPDFTETPEQIRSEIVVSSRLGLRSARKADLPAMQILNYLRLHPQLGPAEAAWLHTKLQGRLAAPWTCLVVVVIALPFGAIPGRRSVFVGVAGSVFLCFAYFMLLQLGLVLGTGGRLPPWLAAWFPNLTFGLAGIWLTARVR